MEEPVHIGLDHGRTVAGAHVRQCLLHGQVNRQRIHAIDFPAGDIESQPACRQTRLGSGFLNRRGHRVQVVFDEETQRQFPGRRQVHGLQHGADVHRAVTEIGDRHGIGPGVPVCPGGTGRQRHTAADDGVGAQGAGLGPLQVHRAAAAFAETLGQAEDFRQGPLQQVLDRCGERCLRVDTLGHQVDQRLGQELVMSTVRAVDFIRRAQRNDRTYRAPFLTDARMRRPMHQAFTGQLQHGLLESADKVQLAEQGAQQRRVGLRPVGVGGTELDPRRGRRQGNTFRHFISPRITRIDRPQRRRTRNRWRSSRHPPRRSAR
ncbi:hypothetical protein D3C81_465070 [compost metagenome]